MTRRSRSLCLGALVLVALAAEGCGQRVSDTGYVGTWKRPLAEGYSIIALREDPAAAGGYQFSWKLRDGGKSVDCDAHGLCEERLGGKAMYEHQFRVFKREGSTDLFVECKGKPMVEGVAPRGYVERLVLLPGGLELRSEAIEVDGVEVGGAAEPLTFAKTSDVPF